LKIVFPGDDKPFRATQLEGGVIRVTTEGRSWGLSPRIKEVFEVVKSDDLSAKESFDRIEALEINRSRSKQVNRAPFSVQLEKVIYREGSTPHRLPN
jgi:hypothetical protein